MAWMFGLLSAGASGAKSAPSVSHDAETGTPAAREPLRTRVHYRDIGLAVDRRSQMRTIAAD